MAGAVSAAEFAGSGPITVSSQGGGSGIGGAPSSPVSAESFLGGGSFGVRSPDGSSGYGSIAGGEGTPGSLQQYAAESANPSGNQNAGFNFQKLFAGTPLSPITPDIATGQDGTTPGKESNIDAFFSPYKQVGSMFANILSDIPAVAAGSVQLINPLNWPSVAEGLVKGAANITSEGLGSINEGIQTGNWNRLEGDLQKATTTLGNHPLQAALALEGALKGAEGAANAASDFHSSITDPSVNFKDTPTGSVLNHALDNIGNARENISKLFRSGKSTLDEHAVELGTKADRLISGIKDVNTKSQAFEKFKAQTDDLQKTQSELMKQLEDAKASATEEGNQRAADLRQQLEDHQDKVLQNRQDALNAEKELNRAKGESYASIRDYMDTKNKAINEAHNGFSAGAMMDGNDKVMQSNLQDFLMKGKRNEQGIYNVDLKGGKINPDTVIKGLEEYQTELNKKGQKDSAVRVQKEINNIKMRDIVNREYPETSSSMTPQAAEMRRLQYGAGNEPIPFEMEQALKDAKIPRSEWAGRNISELRNQNPIITLDDYKSLKNTIYSKAVGNGEEGLSNVLYEKTAAPAFKKAFEDALIDKYGPEQGKETIARLDKTDANYHSLIGNPLFEKENVSLSDVAKNWKELSDTLPRVEGGRDMIARLQNFAAERIMDMSRNSSRPGEYVASRIESNLDKYGDIFKGTNEGEIIRSNIEKAVNELRQGDILQEQHDNAFRKLSRAASEASKQKTIDLSKERTQIERQGNKAIVESKAKAQKAEAIAKNVEQAQKETQDRIKAVGADKADFIKNVQKIDSPEKLDAFVKKSGLSKTEVGDVALEKLIRESQNELGQNRLEPELDSKGNPVIGKDEKPVIDFAKYDAAKAGKLIDKIESTFGGGDQDVQRELLGQTKEMADRGELSERQQQLLDLRKSYDEWVKAKNSKAKTLAGRATNLLLGGLILAVSPYGKFFGIRKVVSALTPDASVEEIGATARTLGKGELSEGLKQHAVAAAKAGALEKTAKESEK